MKEIVMDSLVFFFLGKKSTKPTKISFRYSIIGSIIRLSDKFQFHPRLVGH